MAFGRDKIKNDLKKAIYKAIAKAYKQNIPFVKEAVHGINKEHAVNHIIADLDDDNNVAQVPENHIPVDKDNVLHKDIPDVKQMHDAKEAQAKAKLGVMPVAGQKGAINMSEAPFKGVQKLKKFLDSRQMAKTAWHEKGVHHPTPRDNKDSGESLTGHYARKGDSLAHISDHESGKEVANSLHNEKLAEIKKMPKPNLPKSEEMSKGDPNENHKKLKKIINDLTDQQMHIQAQLNHHTLQGTKHPDEKNLKDTYINLNNQKTNLISQLKEAKKPNLPKSEEMSKARVDEGMTSKAKLQARWDRAGDQTKGVHTAPFKSVPGMSTSRYEIESTGRPTNVARASHKKVLSDIKSMPKPNLPKSEDMSKATESKHDRCVESVEQSSPEVKNPHAVCVARGVTPRKWKK